MRSRRQTVVEQLTQELLGDRIAEFPIDVRAIARQLEIRVVETEDGDSGRLELGTQSATVYLNRHEHESRQRFTLGHELGHWRIRSPQAGFDAMSMVRRTFRSEEVFCDEFAGALLLPTPLVDNAIGDLPRSIGAVQHLATVAQVSLSAAFIRLREMRRWNGVLVQWVQQDGRWVLDADAGLAPKDFGALRSTEATRFTLSQLHAEPGASRSVALPLSFRHTESEFRAEAMACHGRAIALFDVPR